MFLGREPVKHFVLDEIGMEKTAKQTLADLSVVTVRSVRQPVGSLSGGQRQAVAVARAVMRQAKLVILDEPTAALGVTQTRVVLDLIKRLKSQNIAVIVISHNLNDVQSVADRIAVLRLGRLVAVGLGVAIRRRVNRRLHDHRHLQALRRCSGRAVIRELQ